LTGPQLAPVRTTRRELLIVTKYRRQESLMESVAGAKAGRYPI
jgi:hypothetical protein